MKRMAAALMLLASAGVAQAAAPVWPDYQIMEWQPRSAQQLDVLKRIGVSGGMAPINRETGSFDPNSAAPAALRSDGMRYYIENIATDFYAAYHRYTPGKRPNWRFVELQQRYQANLDDLSVFVRDPGLSDPDWLKRVTDRLTAVADVAKADHPIYYSLGDETGIADLAANWDFDIAPSSLAGFRSWLQTQYASLAALNAEWGTRYADWGQVMPELTRTAMQRGDDNFAAWSDFKAWMDVAFARAVRDGTDAVHRADPAGLAAIEGAQVPGWGGYDYTRLAHAVDVMEIYDTYENLAIVRSLNPALIPLTTAFNSGPKQLHAIWREWLRGCRGLVLWDDKSRIVQPDGTLGPDGQGYAPVFAALRGSLGRAVLDAQPVYDPIAVLYSPASFRVAWMQEQRPHGDAWITRTAAQEDTGDAQRETLAAYAQSLAHAGLMPRYVGPDQLARGELGGAKVLILPHAIALSPNEVTAIRQFAAHGGLVVADVVPGTFDGHGRQLSASPLADLFSSGPGKLVAVGDQGMLTTALQGAGVGARFPARVSGNDATTYVFNGSGGTILAVQRDFQSDATPEQVIVDLPHAMQVTDLRDGKALGRLTTVTVSLDPVTPVVLRLSDG
jgi:hypothetical protein